MSGLLPLDHAAGGPDRASRHRDGWPVPDRGPDSGLLVPPERPARRAYVSPTAGCEGADARAVAHRARGGPMLSGRVTGPLDEPVPEASVRVDLREMRFARGGRPSPADGGRTDAEGRFRLEDLPAGPLDLMVSAPGYKQKTVHAVEVPEAGGPPLEISLVRGETLTGTVTDSHGDPMTR